jgi:hypothetical protein
MAYQAPNLKTECMSIQQVRTLLPKVADLCNALAMPPAWHKAHQTLDSALDAPYHPSGGKNLRPQRRTRGPHARSVPTHH